MTVENQAATPATESATAEELAILSALESADLATDPADLPEPQEDTADDAAEIFGRATYSPEDNKLRLYPFERLPDGLYKLVKAYGFKWAPKQGLFVAPSWCPDREDFLLKICGEIEDEEQSLAERAAARAERFGEYRDKRHAEAVGRADRFEAGPVVFGHQSADRATRQARRHDRHRLVAVSQWRKAEYWQDRTEGVIANALYRTSPEVRRGRIKTIETEQRKHEKERAEYAERFAAWSNVLQLPGADCPIAWKDRGIYILPETTEAGRLAFQLSNNRCWGDYQHPRQEGVKKHLSFLLADKNDPITPAEAATLWLAGRREPSNPASKSARWSAHYENRLAYERAMLAQEGGMAADLDIVPGGWFGSHQVQAVNRSNATGRVVSVKIWGRSRWEKSTAPLSLISVNIERMAESDYRAPTAEELAQFEAKKKADKKAAQVAKKSAPKAPQLINPTDADAHRLQEIFNAAAKLRSPNSKPAEVVRMTQAQYSAASEGTYARYGTAEITEKLTEKRRGGRQVIFKIRRTGSGDYYGADRVVILTDKPQKPLPWDLVEAAATEQPSQDKLRPRLGEIASALCKPYLPEEGTEESKLINDARYVGWAYVTSWSQFGFTEAGQAAWQAWRDEKLATQTATA